MRKSSNRVTVAILLVFAITGTIWASGAQDEPEGDLPNVRLTMYSLGATSEQPGNRGVVDAINEILLEDLNATLDVYYVSFAERLEKYPLILASGEPFDLITDASWNNYQVSAGRGAYLPLDEMLPELAPDVWSAYPEAAWSDVRVNGSIYMVPNLTSEVLDHAVAIRGDLREKYGLPPVTDFESLGVFMQAVQDNEDGMIPYNTRPGDFWRTQFFRGSYSHFGAAGGWNGIIMHQQNPEDIRLFLENPYYREVVRAAYEYNQRGFFARNMLSQQASPQQLFQEGQTAVAGVNPNQISDISTYLEANHPDWKIEVAWFHNEPESLVKLAYNNGVAVYKDSPNPERAVMVLDRLFMDPELIRLATWGIEGVNYTLPEEDDPTVVRINAQNTLMYSLMAGTQQDHFGWEVIPRMPLVVERESIYGGLPSNPSNQLQVDYNLVKTENANVSSVYQQYELPLVWGFVDPDDSENGIDAVIQRYKDAGSDAIINMIRTAVEEQL